MGSKQSTANSPSRIVQHDENSASISNSFPSSTTFLNNNNNNRSNDPDQLNNGSSDWRQRARSLTAVFSGDPRPTHSSAIDVLSPFGMSSTSPTEILSMSSNDDNLSASYGFTAHSLPVHFFPFNGNYFVSYYYYHYH